MLILIYLSKAINLEILLADDTSIKFFFFFSHYSRCWTLPYSYKILKIIFLFTCVLPHAQPQSGRPAYPIWSGSSPLTCVTLKTPPTATLPPPQLPEPFDHTSPTATSKH
jgi:hypothetical protein